MSKQRRWNRHSQGCAIARGRSKVGVLQRGHAMPWTAC
jgi:hypothetical protein